MTPSATRQNPISFLKSSQRTIRVFSVLLSVLIVNLFSGCSYYRVKDVSTAGQKSHVAWLQEFNDAQKFIVLHQPGVSL
ncbi:MAG TPA: hypothetical protein VLL47_05920, partial [Robiginitalea sp.]|nr:hypothetical protein [Robiginitalea sp.]